MVKHHGDRTEECCVCEGGFDNSDVSGYPVVEVNQRVVPICLSCYDSFIEDIMDTDEFDEMLAEFIKTSNKIRNNQ